MNSPLVTVIILAYNNLLKIYSTLDSIFEQDYSNIEIIIHDDGSVDYAREWEKVRGYTERNKKDNIKNVIQKHLDKNVGTSKNCNAAIRLANGKYIKFISPEDELYDAHTLSLCVEYAEKNKARIVAGQTFLKRRGSDKIDEVRQSITYRWNARSGRMCNITPTDRDISYLQSLDSKTVGRLLSSRCVLSTVAVFFRKDLLEETGGFLEDYRLIEDANYWPHIAQRGERFYFAHIIMVRYALSGCSNGGAGCVEFNRDFLKILKEIYIPNEYKGGIFNKTLKLLRMRQADYMYGTSHEIKEKLKYMDVQIYMIIRNIKYLLFGTKI